MKNRKDKIEFLKGVASGTRSLKELFAVEKTKMEIWFAHDDDIFYQQSFWNTSKCYDKLTYHELKSRQIRFGFILRTVKFENYGEPKAKTVTE
jgi:hypothetical protein